MILFQIFLSVINGLTCLDHSRLLSLIGVTSIASFKICVPSKFEISETRITCIYTLHLFRDFISFFVAPHLKNISIRDLSYFLGVFIVLLFIVIAPSIESRPVFSLWIHVASTHCVHFIFVSNIGSISHYWSCIESTTIWSNFPSLSYLLMWARKSLTFSVICRDSHVSHPMPPYWFGPYNTLRGKFLLKPDALMHCATTLAFISVDFFCKTYYWWNIS